MNEASRKTGARTRRRPISAAPDVSESQVEPGGSMFWPLLIFFLLLVLAAIPAIWAVGPVFLYIPLAGNQTHGVVYHVGSCESSSTYQERVVFRDAQGQLQETISDTSDECGAGGDATGEVVAVWYLPTLPGDTITGDGGAGVLLFLGVGYLVGVAVGLFFWLKAAWTLIRACMQAEQLARLWQGGLACLVLVLPLLVLAHFLPPPVGQRGDGPTHNFHAGETVLAEGLWAVTVQTGGPRTVAEAGTICLELEVTLRNVTGQVRSLDVSQFALFDGQARALATSCSLDAPKLKDALVPPGSMLTGALAYRVPASLRECYLAFQPGSPEEYSGRYFWRLRVTPAGSVS